MKIEDAKRGYLARQITGPHVNKVLGIVGIDGEKIQVIVVGEQKSSVLTLDPKSLELIKDD